MDRDLIIKARDGDTQAFTQLAARISDRLYAIAVRVLRDRDVAGDALQAALVSIWRDLPQLRDPDQFDAWSYRVLVNCCRSARRSHRSVISVSVQPDDAFVMDEQASVARRDELERAFRALSPEQRAVLVLMYYHDMTVRQVAQVLEVSEGTVKSRAHAARRSMRAAIDAGARAEPERGRTA